MTVARVRARPGADGVEVMFLESARIYALRRTHPRFEAILALLRDDRASRRVMTVTLASPDSDVIEDVAS
jgi:hypothetical protein